MSSATPRLRVKRICGYLAFVLASAAGTLTAQARNGTINISVSVPSADSAHVEERYELRSSLPIELRVLTRPCAMIENLTVERVGLAVNVLQSRDGPWVTFRDTTPADSLPVIVRYDVRLTGSGKIPLVHLATPLTRTNPGAVSVDVTVANRSSRVAFPHMTRQAENHWSARYVAIPSFVGIAGDATRGCVEPADEAGDNGGLVWRFFLLLGIMVAWVPLYLAWARRSGESA